MTLRRQFVAISQNGSFCNSTGPFGETRPDLAVSVLKREGVKDAEIGQQKIARALLEYPLPEEKGIKTALESIGTPKARAAQASEFIDTTLLEEIKQSGFIDRLYQK